MKKIGFVSAGNCHTLRSFVQTHLALDNDSAQFGFLGVDDSADEDASTESTWQQVKYPETAHLKLASLSLDSGVDNPAESFHKIFIDHLPIWQESVTKLIQWSELLVVTSPSMGWVVKSAVESKCSVCFMPQMPLTDVSLPGDASTSEWLATSWATSLENSDLVCLPLEWSDIGLNGDPRYIPPSEVSTNKLAQPENSLGLTNGMTAEAIENFRALRTAALSKACKSISP